MESSWRKKAKSFQPGRKNNERWTTNCTDMKCRMFGRLRRPWKTNSIVTRTKIQLYMVFFTPIYLTVGRRKKGEMG